MVPAIQMGVYPICGFRALPLDQLRLALKDSERPLK